MPPHSYRSLCCVRLAAQICQNVSNIPSSLGSPLYPGLLVSSPRRVNFVHIWDCAAFTAQHRERIVRGERLSSHDVQAWGQSTRVYPGPTQLSQSHSDLGAGRQLVTPSQHLEQHQQVTIVTTFNVTIPQFPKQLRTFETIVDNWRDGKLNLIILFKPLMRFDLIYILLIVSFVNSGQGKHGSTDHRSLCI